MFSVVLVMAGKGTRMQSSKNKALLKINEKPLFMYSLESFIYFNPEIILVINPLDEEEIGKYVDLSRFKVAYGGSTRQESVKHGLELATCEYVMIHDAARALISRKVIAEMAKAFVPNEVFLVAKKPVDTVKILRHGDLYTEPREHVYLAQTPQGGPRVLFYGVHQQAALEGYNGTDDISLIENYAHVKINVIIGNDENFKVTTPADFQMAKVLIERGNFDD